MRQPSVGRLQPPLVALVAVISVAVILGPPASAALAHYQHSLGVGFSPGNGISTSNNQLIPQQQPSSSQPQQILPIETSQGQQQTQSQPTSQQDLRNSNQQLQDFQVPQQPSQQQQQQQSPTQSATQSQHQSRSASDRDSPIFRFHGFPLNGTTIKLVWNLRNGYHADHFDIEWGPIPEGPNTFAVKLNGTARDFTFHQLQPDTVYQFQLQGHGDGLIFKRLEVVKTPPANYTARAPQDIQNRDIMPLGVKAEAKSNNSIQLSWTEQERPTNIRNSHRVNVIRYYINPSLSSSTATATASATSSPTNSHSNDTATSGSPASQPQYHYLNVTNAPESRLIVQRLKPATEYAFAVKTVYSSPDMKRIFTQSGFSMDTLVKTFDLEPSAPRAFTIQSLAPTREEQLAGQTGKLELNWLPPESPNGQIKGYTILYAHEQNAPEASWQRIEVNGPPWFVANLRPGYSYYFKVRAINQRGASQDSETRLYVVPMMSAPNDKINMPIPPNNVLLIVAICMLAILFLLTLAVSLLACGGRRKPRKGSLNGHNNNHTDPTHGNQSAINSKLMANGSLTGLSSTQMGAGAPKLNGFATNTSSSTVTARLGTLARRRDNSSGANKPDFWISAMDQQPEIKSNISEKSNSDLNMAMVSIQRDSPQFATTQLAPALPEYRFASSGADQQQLMQQLQPQHQQPPSHYQPGQFTGSLAYDQMDNATASALMTLSKRQQQQLQKYQIQFASTGGPPTSLAGSGGQMGGGLSSNQQPAQAPSPHQQPPPPPPLNIEQQQQHHHQSLYGTHQTLANTRSLRLHRTPLYDPVSGSFVQGDNGPPNYNSHTHHQPQQHMSTILASQSQFNGPGGNQFMNSNTLQFHPHQTSTLLSRRSTNTLRSFQTNNTYGQLPISNQSFGQPPSSMSGANQQQQPQILQSHQAVINQLNNSNYPSLPLKHVSAVRPQIMSSLEDQIEMELAEKEQQQQPQQQQQQQPLAQPSEQQTIKQ